jgi:hypothetical protein
MDFGNIIKNCKTKEGNMPNTSIESEKHYFRNYSYIIKRKSKQFTLLRSVLQLLVTGNVVPSLQILITLMMEAIHSSERSDLTRTTRSNIPKDGILHIHRRENLKTCNLSTIFWRFLT